MKEKGIIFTADEVRATLAERMTQILRAVKPQPNGMLEWKDVACSSEPVFKECMKIYCPFSQPWDRLFVKEKIGRRPASIFGIQVKNGVELAFYEADGEDVLEEFGFDLCPWFKRNHVPLIVCPTLPAA